MRHCHKLLSGLPHHISDPERLAIKAECAAQKAVLDAIPAKDIEKRVAGLRTLCGCIAGPCIVPPPSFIDYGRHLHLGSRAHFSTGCTILDSASVAMGDDTAFGPNVQIITATHPIRPEEHILKQPGLPSPFTVVTWPI